MYDPVTGAPLYPYYAGGGIGGGGGGWGDTTSQPNYVDYSNPTYLAPYPSGQPGSVLGTSTNTSSNVNPQQSSSPQQTIDPATLAAYDQTIGLINNQLGRLPTSQAAGEQAITNSTNSALQQLLLGRNQAQNAYDTSKRDTASNYIGAKNQIATNAGSSLSGLQRLLGSRGAGGGSAYNIVAPGAVARQATLQRGEVGNAFSQNNRALDTNWNNYLTGYGNSVADVNNQATNQKRELQNTTDTNRSNLLQQLAQLTAQRGIAAGGNVQNAFAAAQPYLSQANGILNNLASYVPQAINYNTTAYNAPSLDSYTTSPATIALNNSAGTDYVSPYLSALLGKKQTNVGA